MNNFYTKDITRDEFKGSVGDFTYGNPIISGNAGHFLRIGKYCSIAGDVHILLGGGHDYTKFTSYPFDNISNNGQKVWKTPHREPDEPVDLMRKIGVQIGNDVWIGCRVTILPGVQIGDGAVIGAGSVVAKDVEPYAVVVGNPIKTIKYRFEPHQIESLLKIKWWDFTPDEVQEALSYFYDDINNFIKRYEK